MAHIPIPRQTTTFQLRRFLGLNENPDGDTTLKEGELAQMQNFRITPNGHLQIRPGTRTVVSLAEALTQQGGDPNAAALHGFWQGTVGGKPHLLACYGGHLWDISPHTFQVSHKGESAPVDTTFFPFDNKVYLLNGQQYLCWDGGETTQFQEVEPYIPLIQVATTPAGGGTTLENLNRLTGKRRVRFSPDGTAKTFQLPEKELDEVCAAQLGEESLTGYTCDLAAGTVTFSSPPAQGTDTLTITYRKGDGSPGDVKGMRFTEFFNGATDARIFLYGDTTHRAIYSGIPYDTGQPSADYFPQLFEVAVGESNTPLTALVRHYTRLMAFKPGSAWVIGYDTMTLSDQSSIPAFTVRPVNRQFGNDTPGQVRLLENDPLTLDVGGVYQWKAASSGGYANGSDSNTRSISQRVERTLSAFSPENMRTANLKHHHEYWFLEEGKALILNYANDSWYFYDHLPFREVLEAEGEIYAAGMDGRIFHFSRTYRSDDGAPIPCYAATGAMDFQRSWQMKYSPQFFVAMQPENSARITVGVESNRRSDYPQKLVAYSLAGFDHVDFGHFSFATNRKPQVQRVKLKVKKATFYRLIFRSNSASATATVLQAHVKLRYTGNVK